MVKKINAEQFANEAKKSAVAVVDFSATWCGPCRMLAPTIAKIAEEQEGKIKVCKVDVDECPRLAAKFGISSIPTLMVFEDGYVKASTVGVQPKSQIERLFA